MAEIDEEFEAIVTTFPPSLMTEIDGETTFPPSLMTEIDGEFEAIVTTFPQSLMAEIDGEFEAIVTKGWKNNTSSNKRSKKNEGDDEGFAASVELVLLREPLDVFGSDIMLLILDNLDARDVALCLLVSRGWNEVASSDSLWNTRCEELWLGKAHIPRMLPGISRLAAYSFSFTDGKRTRIMKEDLCDHVWDFRFKKEVPEYWLNLDPSWNGTGPPMRRYFHLDGSQSADPDDQVWGGHECTFKTITSFVGEGKIGERYVRINRWPHMTVARKHDWSWELTNRLYWYSSTPDADKEGGTGPLPQCGM